MTSDYIVHFNNVLQRVGLKFKQGGTHALDALCLFDVERSNIEAAWQLALKVTAIEVQLISGSVWFLV